MSDWLIRFIKGIFIGSGFILPGVSGGALAAVFGVYEKIISFLAHITKNFKENFLFLLPLGLGGIAGVFIFSFVLSFFLEAYEPQILWVFIGCIVGTIPTLWKQAGIKGREKRHYATMITTFIFLLAFMYFGESLFSHIPQNFFTWVLAGSLIGLGVIVPGLSPSNLLIYLGMYKDMADGIKHMDLTILIPIAIGGALTLLLLSKVMEQIFKKAYTGFFHFILGVVFASTLMIIPLNFNYLSVQIIPIILCFILGIMIGLWMTNLELKYKK